MLLPIARRLLEASRSGNVTNTSINISGTTLDEGFPSNSSITFNETNIVDFGESDFGFSDMQTVFLACIATLIPLVFTLLAAIGVRHLWHRLRARKGEGYEGVLQRDESSDPLAVKSLSASGNLLTDELKTSESQFSVTPAEEIEDITSQAPLLSYSASSVSMPNHTSKRANGSIITMTLKNNHLIVETEERGGVTDGSTKTTTTKFTTSASPHENNVFVVEVQQGGVPRTSDCFADNSELYPKLSSSAVSSQEDIDEEDGSRRSSSQRAQVHRPPDIDVDEVSDEDDLEDIDDEEEEEDDTTERVGTKNEREAHESTNTGLSQSDLSISSSGSNNPSYRYGNQLGYEGGHFGYPQYAGYSSSEDKFVRTASSISSSSSKAAIIRRYPQAPTAMKRASSVTEGTDKPPTVNPGRGRYSIDATPVSARLLSDIQAMERRRIQLEDDRIQEEQRQLGNGTVKINDVAPLAVANGDSTPSSVEEEQSKNGKSEDEVKTEASSLQRTGSLPSKLKKETNTSVDESNDVTPKPGTQEEKATSETNPEKGDCDGITKKRASLPVITPELYTQIKQTTKSLILDKTSRPGLSPKFQKFRNENSPLDETEKEDTQQVSDSTPAKSQEYENEAFVSSDQITS